jgi:hypothetical protein
MQLDFVEADGVEDAKRLRDEWEILDAKTCGDARALAPSRLPHTRAREQTRGREARDEFRRSRTVTGTRQDDLDLLPALANHYGHRGARRDRKNERDHDYAYCHLSLR